MTRAVIRVGAVDDHPAVLLGVATAMNALEGFHLVAAARTVPQLLAISTRMDVVLLAPSLIDGSAVERNIATLDEIGARVLLLVDDGWSSAQQPVDSGVSGVARRGDDGAKLAERIRAAAAGAPRNAGDAQSRMPAVTSAGLTRREADVLALYAAGETAESVAQRLFVTRETVLDHVRRIRAKYAAAGRPAATKIDLLRRAIEDGIAESSG